MMADVEKQELAAIGAQVEVPEAASYRSATARGARRNNTPGSTAATDRLTELSSWWATVAGTAPPRRVQQLWPDRPSSLGLSRAQVVLRPFDPPEGIAEAVNWGVTVADSLVDDGTDLVLLSVPDEVSWTVLSAHLLDVDAVEAMGWPSAAGLSDLDWIVRVAAIRDGLRTVRGISGDPELLLTRIASPAIAAGTALVLRAAARRTPILLDGPGAAACALLAFRIARASRNWLQASDGGAGALHDRVLAELRLVPLTRLGLRGDDGTAARIALGLLETALARAIQAPDNDLTDDVPADDDPALDHLLDDDSPDDDEAADDEEEADEPTGDGPTGDGPTGDGLTGDGLTGDKPAGE
jgi:hypothetical protein